MQMFSQQTIEQGMVFVLDAAVAARVVFRNTVWRGVHRMNAAIRVDLHVKLAFGGSHHKAFDNYGLSGIKITHTLTAHPAFVIV